MTRALLCLSLSLAPIFTRRIPATDERHAWMVHKLGGKIHVKTMIA